MNSPVLKPFLEKIETVVLIKGAGDGTPYSYVYYKDIKRPELIARNVGYFHGVINKENFHRINKSTIVNSNFITHEDKSVVIVDSVFKIFKVKGRSNRKPIKRVFQNNKQDEEI